MENLTERYKFITIVIMERKKSDLNRWPLWFTHTEHLAKEMSQELSLAAALDALIESYNTGNLIEDLTNICRFISDPAVIMQVKELETKITQELPSTYKFHHLALHKSKTIAETVRMEREALLSQIAQLIVVTVQGSRLQ